MKNLSFYTLLFFTIFGIGAVINGATHHVLTLVLTAIFWRLYHATYTLKKSMTL